MKIKESLVTWSVAYVNFVCLVFSPSSLYRHLFFSLSVGDCLFHVCFKSFAMHVYVITIIAVPGVNYTVAAVNGVKEKFIQSLILRFFIRSL